VAESIRPRDPLVALATLPSPWPWHRRVVKRAVDLTASSLALVVLALPLAILGLLLRLRSPGPALFFQERVGRRGRRFRVWKLRTMVAGAPALGPQVTAAGDPRVTPLGRLLRKTKLDELPQLVNVWKGEMSLVGPRPEVPRYVLTYSTTERELLAVRPGLTDPASIAYHDEESQLAGHPDRERAYAEVILPRKLALSRAWLYEQSFFGDLVILLRTAGLLLRRRCDSRP
jgi:lipopolysaccharide/colanic/teichoic acid biosynthesis glycosyltransferase